MDYNSVVSKIYPQAIFNSACFQFSESEARAKKLWTDGRPMPTQAQLEEAEILVNSEIAAAESAKVNRMNLIKDKTGNTKDRLDALIEHLGLDI